MIPATLTFWSSFNVQARPGLLDHIQIENELSEIFGRDVDLLSRRSARV